MEDFLDGGLSEAQRALVREHLNECPACRLELEAARSVVKTLSTLPQVKCSKPALRSIEEATLKEKSRASLLERILYPGDFPLWKTASIALAGAAIVLLIVLTAPEKERPIQPAYTAEEALRARTLARENLGRIVGLINKTERKAVRGFLKDNLPRTVRRSIKRSAPFQKGGRQ